MIRDRVLTPDNFFLFVNLREKRTMPLIKESGIARFKNFFLRVGENQCVRSYLANSLQS